MYKEDDLIDNISNKCNYCKYKVSDSVVLNTGEEGMVISLSGPPHTPLLVLFRRSDYHCDDVAFFPLNGISSDRFKIDHIVNKKFGKEYD